MTLVGAVAASLLLVPPATAAAAGRAGGTSSLPTPAVLARYVLPASLFGAGAQPGPQGSRGREFRPGTDLGGLFDPDTEMTDTLLGVNGWLYGYSSRGGVETTVALVDSRTSTSSVVLDAIVGSLQEGLPVSATGREVFGHFATIPGSITMYAGAANGHLTSLLAYAKGAVVVVVLAGTNGRRDEMSAASLRFLVQGVAVALEDRLPLFVYTPPGPSFPVSLIILIVLAALAIGGEIWLHLRRKPRRHGDGGPDEPPEPGVYDRHVLSVTQFTGRVP